MDTWQKCLDRLEGELSAQQFNTWIRPLQVIEDEKSLRLLAPNRFVLDWVSNRFLRRIHEIVHDDKGNGNGFEVHIEIGSAGSSAIQKTTPLVTPNDTQPKTVVGPGRTSDVAHVSNLNPENTFDYTPALVQFSLSSPFVDVALLGMRSARHVEQNVAICDDTAGRIDLDALLYSDIASTICGIHELISIV